mgnify:CR=1 FL=1
MLSKKLNNIWPENAKAIIVKNATIVAFLAVCFLCCLLKEAVIVINIGMVPNGFMMVKKAVNARMAKVYNSFTIYFFVNSCFQSNLTQPSSSIFVNLIGCKVFTNSGFHGVLTFT